LFNFSVVHNDIPSRALNTCFHQELLGKRAGFA